MLSSLLLVMGSQFWMGKPMETRKRVQLFDALGPLVRHLKMESQHLVTCFAKCGCDRGLKNPKELSKSCEVLFV